MLHDASRSDDSLPDEVPVEDLPARPTHDAKATARPSGGLGLSRNGVFNEGADDDVIRIEDLTPRETVTGGRKVILGEVATRPEEQKL